MKKSIFLFLLFLLPLHLLAQALQWQWAQIGNDGDFGWGSAIATDDSGNIYITGNFTNTLNIGSYSLISHGNSDIYWAKYNLSGQLLWAKTAGGTKEEQAFGIAVDKSGNVYVGSFYTDTAFYDTVRFISKGFADLAVAKYDNNGNQQWVKSWGSIYTERGSKLFFSKDYLYITGNFAGNGGSPTTYETINIDGMTLTSHGDGDVFVAKLDTNGNLKWAKNAGGKFPDFVGDITVDSFENIFITGSGNSKMYFDNDTLLNKSVFIAKYDSSGTVKWLNGAASSGYALYGTSLAADHSGNIITGGYSNEDQAFDFGGGVVLNNHDQAYVAKYDPTGNLLWAKNLSTYCFYDAIEDMTIDASNNIYVAGHFNYLGVFGGDTLYSNGHDDIYIIKLDSNGNYIWAAHAGGTTNDGALGIALDNAGDLVVTGYVSSAPASFGIYQINATGYWDTFVAKLSATTGVPIINGIAEAGIYPNPTTGLVNIEFRQEGYKQVKVFDQLGRQVFSRSLHLRKSTIHLDELSNGVYYLQLCGAKETVSKKIIIQH